MSDVILGYDCQGEALRAGDRVEIVRAKHKEFEGVEVTITGPWPEHMSVIGLEVDTDLPAEPNAFYPTRGGMCKQYRLINSGRDLFNQCRDRALSEGNPDARTEPTTTERAQAWLSGQPWTEPE